MKITGTTPASIRPADAKASATTQPQTQPAAKPAAVRNDSVQISDAGRALSGSDSSLSPERAAQIRQRVLSGAYHSAEMAGEVAKRMLEKGDV
jgi:anti-sigma28 factor (negative regulator of flagellin synthesis)